MNRRPPGLLSVSKAIEGFINYKLAEGLQPRAIASYEWVLHKWVEHRGDLRVDRVNPQVITAYLGWLRTEYQPRRLNGKLHPLSPNPLRNVLATLLSFLDGPAWNLICPIRRSASYPRNTRPNRLRRSRRTRSKRC